MHPVLIVLGDCSRCASANGNLRPCSAVVGRPGDRAFPELAAQHAERGNDRRWLFRHHRLTARHSPPQISMTKLLLAFVLGGLLLLCAAYSIIAYYRLVSIAKGI